MLMLSTLCIMGKLELKRTNREQVVSIDNFHSGIGRFDEDFVEFTRKSECTLQAFDNISVGPEFFQIFVSRYLDQILPYCTVLQGLDSCIHYFCYLATLKLIAQIYQ